MRRQLLTVLSALSLVLCVATIALWASGYSQVYGRVWSETAAVGRVRLSASVNVNGHGLGVGVVTPRSVNLGKYRTHTGFGFSYLTGDAYSVNANGGAFLLGGYCGVGVPFWFLVLGGTVIPTAWLWRRHRGRGRLRGGLCPKCGYDLTGNVSGTCPECGTAVNRTQR